VIWYLLSDPEATFINLGPDHYDTHGNTQRAVRNHVRKLETYGYKVTLEAA
jgi:transposase